MSTNSVGTAFLEIAGDWSRFNQQLDQNLNTSQGKFGKFSAAAVAGVAAVGVAALAAGKELYNIGGAFDDASDTIRVKTGKTGKALAGLEKDFKSVVKTTPTDFGTASKAVAELNQKLGLSGKPLQHMSKQVLELSRLTETDLSANIKSVSRVFGDWGIKTEDQSAALDKLWRASQRTGVPVDKLGDSIVKFGAPLRQLGFSFEESAAMVGKFEKEGVNTQLVMGSMRQALGRLAKAGKDPQAEFEKTTKAIKAAGSAGEANKLALELFGARAGPDMAAAIREGRFEMGSLVDQIKGGGDTIMKASEDTADFAEKWQILKNRVWLGLEPIATRVFGAVGDSMDLIEPAAEAVRTAFEQVKGAISGAGDGSGRLTQALGSLKGAFQGIKDIVTTVVVYAKALWAEFGDDIIAGLKNFAQLVGDVVAAIARTLKGVVDFVAGVLTLDLGRAWDGIKNIFGGAWDAITAIVDAALDHIGIALGAAWEVIKGGASLAWDWIKQKAGELWGGIKDTIVRRITETRDWLAAAWGAVRDAATGAWDAIRSKASEMWDGIRNRIQSAIREARDTISGVWTSIRERAESAWDGIKTLASSAWDAITGAITGVFTGKDGLKSKLAGIWHDIEETAGKGWRAIKTAIGDAIDGVAGVIEGPLNLAGRAVTTAINAIIGVLNKIPGVEIGKVEWKNIDLDGSDDKKGKKSEVPGYARGGVVHHDRLVKGAMVTRPLFAVGEEAPRWPEAIIPFNPRYRDRARALWATAGAKLGVPGFAQGGIYSQKEMEDLWVQAGGPEGQKKIAGAVGMAESRGNSQVVNSIGAGGLWQIHPPEPGYLNPLTNARIAVRKWRESGWKPWEAYTGPDGVGDDGPWRQFIGKNWIEKIVGAVTDPLQFARELIGKLPDFDLPDWMSGLGSWLTSKAKSVITDKAKSVFGGGGSMGNDSPTWNAIRKIIADTGNVITSTTGGKHAPNSWHYKGRAWDFAGGNMLAAAKTIAAEFGDRLLELFFTPLGFSIKNGQKTGLIAAEGHNDHVHVAFQKGGIYGPEGVAPFVGSYYDGGVVPADGYAYVHRGEEITSVRDRNDIGDIYVALGDGPFTKAVDARIEIRDRATGGVFMAGVRA